MSSQKIVNIHEATTAYEAWLGARTKLIPADLDFKHARMADAVDPFPFFRGTYYRWAQHWPGICPELADAPKLLAVGDLHIENFGTWRDGDGRLCWGINDFDEADELPFAQDLVRLASSVHFAKWAGWEVKFKSACAAILDGYHLALKSGGDPFVLEERHPELRAMAMSADRDPVVFWKKLTKLLANPVVEPPPAAQASLIADLPVEILKPEFRYRPQVGVGSLGKPRYVALVEWAGGWVAREAKAVTSPATAWGSNRETPSRLAEVAAKAKRAPDPYYRASTEWITRRLAPRCSRIELDHLVALDDVTVLLRSMGAETANVHCGTADAPAILAYLKKLDDGWLPRAAKSLAEAIRADWADWRTGSRK